MSKSYNKNIPLNFSSGNIVLSSTTSISNTVNNYSTSSGTLNITGDTVSLGDIYFITTGLGAPTLNGRGAGNKIILYPQTNTTQGDYSIGVENLNMWFQVPSTNSGYKFYHGTSANVVISTGGNVGIGTTNPGRPLEVRTGSSTYGIRHSDGTIKLDTYVGGSINGAYFGTTSQHPLGFMTNDSSALMTIQTNGNVGIGTTNPGVALHIGNLATDANVRSTVSLFVPNKDIESRWLYLGWGSGTEARISTDQASKPIIFSQNDVEKMRIDASGNLQVTNNLTNNNPSWFITGGSGNAVYTNTSGNYFANNGTGNSFYFNTVVTFGTASSSAWNSSTGVFTAPVNGLYLIQINFFINGSVGGRWGRINFTSTSYTTPSFFYLPFESTNLGNATRGWSCVRQFSSGDTFNITCESGAVTLYLADGHTTLEVTKIS